MTLEALVSNELYEISSFNIENEISSKPHFESLMRPIMDLHYQNLTNSSSSSLSPIKVPKTTNPIVTSKQSHGITKTSTTKSRKRCRKPRVCKNKEEAETQRMIHIAVERNRRRQMNEYLAALRSLMPESYVQRGDQASIVGGAIEFVKELEQLLQSLQARKYQLEQLETINRSTTTAISTPFVQFFNTPQFTWCPNPSDSSDNRSTIANIEVTMVETHANIRILSERRPRQLLKLVVGFQNLRLTILHLNLTTLSSFVLYSFNAKVEEGCHLSSVEDIAAAVHHMLIVIEEESALV